MVSAQRPVRGGGLACKKPHFNISESAVITACSECFECMQKGVQRPGYEGKTRRVYRNRQHKKEEA